jgi:hypothetical protein
MTVIIPLEDVDRVRGNVARAHELAAARFRDEFAGIDLPPEERWRVYLGVRAAALLEAASSVGLRRGTIAYEVEGRRVTPYVVRGEPLYPFFRVPRTPYALFEYWIVVSEIVATPSWNLTRVVAVRSEFDAALRAMKDPQLVHATFTSFLPAAEWRDDGTALLEVTVYTRAEQERIERRTLTLDSENEFHFHSRELVAEGSDGVVI